MTERAATSPAAEPALGDVPALRIDAAIRRLKAEFLLAVDQKRWEDFAGLFLPDARIDYSRTRRSWGPGEGPVYSGPAAFMVDVSAMLADAQSVHHATAPIIDVIDAGHAKAIWRMEDIVLRSAGSALPQGHGFGLYDEDYRLTASGWRIASLTFTRLLVLPIPSC